MNKFNTFKDSSFEKNKSNEDNNKNQESKDKLEKILCNHCGRTARNGIRCLGMCVADDDY